MEWRNKKVTRFRFDGLSLMVTISEGFIQSIEKRALVIARLPANSACPISHKRYFDDSHDIYGSRRSCEKFLNILNSLEPKIQFTSSQTPLVLLVPCRSRLLAEREGLDREMYRRRGEAP